MTEEKFQTRYESGASGLDWATAMVHVLPIMFLDDSLRRIHKLQVGSRVGLSFTYEQDELISLAFTATDGGHILAGGYVELVLGSSLTSCVQNQLAIANICDPERLFEGLHSKVKINLVVLGDQKVVLNDRAVVSQILKALLDRRVRSRVNVLDQITLIIQGLQDRNQRDRWVGEFEE